MSEIAHPQVDLDLLSANSLEQNLAQSMALMLMDSCLEREEIIASTLVCTQLTERVDMESSVNGKLVALRLRSIPVLSSVSFNLENCQPSPDHLVVSLEHATYNDFTDEVDEDDDLDWQPYILAVVKADHPEYAEILNAKSGQDLSIVDLQMARILLSKLTEELNDDRCKETDLFNLLKAGYRPIPNGPVYEEFDSAEHIDTEPCVDPCNNQHSSCSHSVYSLN